MTRLEIEPVTATEYAQAERAFAQLVGTELDPVIIQGEAILPLEATARGLGRPGSSVLNIVTSPYGAAFGGWLQASGARVRDIVVPADRAVSAEEVAAALACEPFDVVSVVHAEAGSGVVNPLSDIAGLAREAGALVVVDAVASVGAEPLDVDAWGLDLVVLSAQKALAGPSGVAPVLLSKRAWDWLDTNPAAPRDSVLSLLDWKTRWLSNGRTKLPVIPHHAEMRAFEAAIDDALADGIDAIIRRHAEARDACRRLAPTIGLDPWVVQDSEAAAIATTLRPPSGVDVAALIEATHNQGGAEIARLVSAAPFAPSSAIRINHTGRRATVPHVYAALAAVVAGLRSLGVNASIERDQAATIGETRLNGARDIGAGRADASTTSLAHRPGASPAIPERG